jgi:hypothetical protein
MERCCLDKIVVTDPQSTSRGTTIRNTTPFDKFGESACHNKHTPQGDSVMLWKNVEERERSADTQRCCRTALVSSLHE